LRDILTSRNWENSTWGACSALC